MNALALQLRRWPSQQPILFLVVAAAIWFALYQSLIPASEALVAALPVDRASHLGGALQFFLYDTPKVLLLLTGIVFVMGIVHTFVSPERTRAVVRPSPGHRQRDGGQPRHRDAVLLVLGGAAVHRLFAGRRAADAQRMFQMWVVDMHANQERPDAIA